jgi:hypothetical protein
MNVVLRDGRVVERPLVNKRVPATVEGIDAASVASLEVHLVSRPLTDIEIVDTPGLESLRAENSEQTTEFLDPASKDACAGADAIVYCMTNVARAGDLTTLYETGAKIGDAQALGTIAVLNRADQITGGWAKATEQAGVIAENLRGLAADVVPLSALPAAAARCGLFDAELQRAVSDLAALSEEERQLLMIDSGLFVTEPAGTVSPEIRERLLMTTSFAGAVAAVDHLVRVPGDRAGATEAIDGVSRFQHLEAKIVRLRSRADALKAQNALAGLERIAASATVPPSTARELLDLVADLRTSGALAGLKQLKVMDDAHRDPNLLTADEVAELDRLFVPGEAWTRLGQPDTTSTRDLAALALARASFWQGEAGPLTPTQRAHAARIAKRSYVGLWEQLTTEEQP